MAILRKNIKAFVDTLDAGVASLGMRAFGEQAGLSIFLFHAINENRGSPGSLFPQEDLTLGALDRFINALLDFEYTFVSPKEVVEGHLDPRKKYGMLTFDDGYFNNTWCANILSTYEVPAVFFITTRLVVEQEKQWADIVFYERSKRGGSVDSIRKEIIGLIPQRISNIRDYITKEFGIQSFIPHGDHDRPMNEEELHLFSRHPQVYIGNHSHSHEPLRFLTPEEVRHEFKTSQEHLKRFTGKLPTTVAYPYGLYSGEVVNEARNIGFCLGVTTQEKKLTLPIDQDSILSLPRLNPVANNEVFNFDVLRSPIQFKTCLKKIVSTTNRLF